jgi:hypothetical protein
MTPHDKFAALLKDDGIKFFSAKEVFYLGDSNDRLRLNSIPAEWMWERILPTLHFLDAVRARAGRLRLTSIYRNAAYNRAVGGARNSQHAQFRACDIQPLDVSVRDLWDIMIDERRLRKFAGGLGRYRTFCHADCRGSMATWTG